VSVHSGRLEFVSYQLRDGLLAGFWKAP
jgi:hypothetical protein